MRWPQYVMGSPLEIVLGFALERWIPMCIRGLTLMVPHRHRHPLAILVDCEHSRPFLPVPTTLNIRHGVLSAELRGGGGGSRCTIYRSAQRHYRQNIFWFKERWNLFHDITGLCNCLKRRIKLKLLFKRIWVNIRSKPLQLGTRCNGSQFIKLNGI